MHTLQEDADFLDLEILVLLIEERKQSYIKAALQMAGVSNRPSFPQVELLLYQFRIHPNLWRTLVCFTTVSSQTSTFFIQQPCIKDWT